ncbi:MAG: BamA/TamA family outer membrane protein [Bacteroidetes bacterium]|nr:BamA/TamA family outer membrane protein [Bacteroidota bacterium]
MTFLRVCALFLVLSPPVLAQREIGSIGFDGALTFSKEELRAVIQSQETPWALWKWLNSINAEIGSPPQYFDPLVLEADLWSLRRFYDDQGFHRVSIDTSLTFTDDRVAVLFRVVEGPRAIIDSVHVTGTSDASPALREEVRSGALIAPGQPLVLSKVEAEFRRLIGLYSDYGYVNVNAVAKEAVELPALNRFVVRFDFEPGPQYLFGPVEVVADTNSLEPVDPAVVRRHLDFQEGDLYSESRKIESERLLNRLGIFDASRIENAAPAESTGRVAIPTRVTVRTRSFQELAPEIGINDEDNVLNLLAGLGYQHRNFLGDARNLTTAFRLSLRSFSRVSLQKLFSADATRDRNLVAKAEVTTQLIQPYFFSNKVSLTASLSGIWDKQKEYYVPVLRTKMGVTAQTATYTRLFADWNLEWSDPRSVVTQQDTSLPDLYERQFNSILTLTLQSDRRNDLFAPTAGSFQSITLEEAGQLPRLFRGLLDTQVPFSQYVRLILVGQYYLDPGEPRGTVWAARVRVGAAELYGRSPADVPIYRKFFGGGSNSIRGWKARELGAVLDPAKGGNALVEASIEARLRPLDDAGEFLFLDLRKMSFVLFGDAGNVWTRGRSVRGSEVAMAAGFGIRYDTVAGPIRLDFGMKVYDPQAAQNRWISDKRFFPETFAGGIIHLGIGQAF